MQRKVSRWLACLCAFVACFGGCASVSQDVTVYAPDGAPAMAFAQMMETDSEQDGVSYKIVAPTLIASKVTNADQRKNADICVLPVTAASKLLGTGEKYRSLGVVTSGNLYLLTKDTDLKKRLQNAGYKNLDPLIGKTVGVMKINDMPGLTFKSVLGEYGLEWQEIKNDTTMSAMKVNLRAISDGASIHLNEENVACYLVAEPAASVQIRKNGFMIACSLETLYHQGELPNVGEYQGYPQAVIVAKKSLIEQKKEWLDDFLSKLQASTAALHTSWATGEKILSIVEAHREDPAYVSTLKAEVLTAETIARCRVGFVGNSLCKQAVKTYLSRIVAMNGQATKIPSEEFFYVG